LDKDFERIALAIDTKIKALMAPAIGIAPSIAMFA
jgi:hypothetical protein